MATAVFTHRIPADLKARLRIEAARRRCSMARLVELFISDGLKKNVVEDRRLEAFKHAARNLNANADA